MAIGIPQRDVGEQLDAGAVSVIYSSGSDGLGLSGSQFRTADALGGSSVEEDGFGGALAAGDFNGDGKKDLAIGIPGKDLVNTSTGALITNAGAVNVLYGSSSGLTTTGTQFWTQDSPGVADQAEPGDRFGSSLTAWNFGKGQRRTSFTPPLFVPLADLAIGVPGEDLTDSSGATIQDAGAVNVLYGTPSGLFDTSSTGLTSSGNQFWTQDSSGVPNAAEAGDQFGWALY